MLGHVVDVAQLLRGYGIALGDLSDVLARRYGERLALEDAAPTPGLPTGSGRTYRDVEEAVARLAAAHRTMGTSAGDVVLVVCRNRIDIVFHAMALARVGAVAAPVNSRLAPGEMSAVAAAAGAVAAVADPDIARDIGGATGLRHLAWRLTTDGGDAVDVAAWLAAHPGQRMGPTDRDPDATALILATSGTTGTPKAARLTSHGLLGGVGRLAMAPVGWRVGPRAHRDLALAALPLTHVMGFSVVLSALCAGVPLVHRARFDAAEVLDVIEERRPNVFVGVPTMYADLESAGANDRDLASVQLWVSAADIMPAARARRFQQYGAAADVGGWRLGTAAFADVYGMVEMSGPAAVRLFPPSLIRPVPAPPLSVTLPGVEVRAVDDDGAPVAWGRVGQLQFRGPGVLASYADGPEACDSHGWLSTGDLGRVWPGGVLTFVGRTRDRLKVSGFSVFPAEVEARLRRHPDVADVALVGLPDERHGDRPVALVVPGSDSFDAEVFLDWAATEVAGYRRPRAAYVIDALPRGPHGKVDRAAASHLAADLAGKSDVDERTHRAR
ncbi:MAG: acyl--CoA ligase [Actinomycetota bacterium]|nr:acyl--CoA ligase [Actinomycetota bacterium]